MTAAAGAATTLFASVGAPNLDFTPVAAGPAATGGLTTFPARISARITSFFGTTPLAGTSFRGAASPDGSNKWWEGWTAHATN